MVSLVRTAKQVYRWNPAQRLGSLAHGRAIGARTRYQANREPYFGQRVFRAQRAKRIGSGKDYLEIRSSALERGKELRRIGYEWIASAFYQQGVGGQRDAEIKRFAEEITDPFTTHRKRGRQTEIDAIESISGAKIQVPR